MNTIDLKTDFFTNNLDNKAVLAALDIIKKLKKIIIDARTVGLTKNLIDEFYKNVDIIQKLIYDINKDKALNAEILELSKPGKTNSKLLNAITSIIDNNVFI